jgi:hypothetical protein
MRASSSAYSIDWAECYLEPGILSLPFISSTIKTLDLRNLLHFFPKAIPDPSDTLAADSEWIESICANLQAVQILRLVNCRIAKRDADNLRLWLPWVNITLVEDTELKSMKALEQAWRYDKNPCIAAELISRYNYVGLLKERDLLVQESLPIALDVYIRQNTFEAVWISLPWVALALKSQEQAHITKALVFLHRHSSAVTRSYLSRLIAGRVEYLYRLISYVGLYQNRPPSCKQTQDLLRRLSDKFGLGLTTLCPNYTWKGIPRHR